jgi:DNA-binding CsgD family transcriptional regulator
MATIGNAVNIQSGRVTLASAKLQQRLREIAGQMKEGRNLDFEWMKVPRGPGERPLRLLMMKTEDSGAIPLGVSLTSLAIQIVDADSDVELSLEVLEQLFSLTPSEARVVAKLTLGRSIEEIAAETRTSTETIRTHLKRVLSKTRTRRQGELISLVLRSSPFRA